MQVRPAPLQCQCKGIYFSNVFTYDAPPEGEIAFEFSSSGTYRREILRCDLCAHFVSVHKMDAGGLYSEDYVSSTYQDDEGIYRTFQRILSLSPSKSDNIGRVRRILQFASTFWPDSRQPGPPSILDVGSGLGVFPYKMKEAGWECTALDPDIRSVRHTREFVGVRSIHGDFMSVKDLGRFDAVSFNKVLEHVEDPVAMLARSAECLEEKGFIYVEVPDGEAAAEDGSEREEFFIDHLHVFSPASLSLLTARAGLFLCSMERLREPSTKFTLRAFLTIP